MEEKIYKEFMLYGKKVGRREKKNKTTEYDVVQIDEITGYINHASKINVTTNREGIITNVESLNEDK